MRSDFYIDHKGNYRLVRKRLTKGATCAVRYCRNKPEKKMALCYSCHRAEVRKNNPLWAEWHDKAYRHTRRGQRGVDRPCCTFEEWKAFHATRPSDGYVVDRIDPLGGYTLDNMQWLTAHENAVKGATFDKARYAEARRLGMSSEESMKFASAQDEEEPEREAEYADDYETEFHAAAFTPSENEPF